jgi:hypothetical protein
MNHSLTIVGYIVDCWHHGPMRLCIDYTEKGKSDQKNAQVLADV